MPTSANRTKYWVGEELDLVRKECSVWSSAFKIHLIRQASLIAPAASGTRYLEKLNTLWNEKEDISKIVANFPLHYLSFIFAKGGQASNLCFLRVELFFQFTFSGFSEIKVTVPEFGQQHQSLDFLFFLLKSQIVNAFSLHFWCCSSEQKTIIQSFFLARFHLICISFFSQSGFIC